ncbi:MAG: transcription elongation factor Spt5 [Promethearchaeota archaeon]
MSIKQDSDAEQAKTTIFAVRTTIGQEKTVLQGIFNRLRVLNPFPDLKALLIANELRGYVFIEAVHQRDVMIAISSVRHVKGKIVGSISLDSIKHVISPRKVTEILEEGDIVEIISGVFATQKAEVIRMPKDNAASQDVTLRLIDSDSAISIKIHGDFLKLVEKGKKHKEEYLIKDMEEKENTLIPAENASDIEDGEEISNEEEGSTGEESVYTFGDEKEESEETAYEEAADVKSDAKDYEDEEEEEEDEWSKFGF